MARSLRTHFRRRRMQRWLRREALMLAREAEMFDCQDARREAQRLVEITAQLASKPAMLRTA